MTTGAERPEGPLTTVITREVVPGREQDFEQWLKGVTDAASRFEGHQGVTILRPADGAGRVYVLVVRWADYEGYARWESSEVRAEWLKRVEVLSANDPALWSETGLETWFTLPGQKTSGPPPKTKMALLTWCAIYPLILGLQYALAPLLGATPIPARALLMTAILIPTMTWVVMPRLTRAAWPWLYPGVPRP